MLHFKNKLDITNIQIILSSEVNIQKRNNYIIIAMMIQWDTCSNFIKLNPFHQLKSRWEVLQHL